MNVERLRTLMADVLGVDVADITENASPETIPSWDSLHHMNLIVAIEDEFGVQLPEDRLSDLTSLPALTAVLDPRSTSSPA